MSKRVVALAFILVLASYALLGLPPTPAYAQEPPRGTRIGGPSVQQMQPSTLKAFKEHFTGGWDIVIYDGNDAFYGGALTTSLSWTTPFSPADVAKTTFVVADGQSNGPLDTALFNSVVVAGPGSTVRPADAFPGADPRLGASSFGSLWDTLTLDVTSHIASGATSATAASGAPVDCLVWVAQVFAHGPSSSPAGYTGHGASLRNQPSGVISITDIPAGAEVTGAFLYFTVLAYAAPTPTMSLNGVDVTSRAVLVGSDVDPCWIGGSSFSYRYDVTDLVAGNAAYTVSSYPTDDTSSGDPWAVGCVGGPCAEGASLVVIYDPIPPVGGAVIEPGPMTGLLGMLPWILMAVVAVGAGAYVMRKRYAAPILARIR